MAKAVAIRGTVALRPARSSSSTRQACGIITAKFMFWERRSPSEAVLMPITLPVARSINGPPELPGLMGASVWIIG